MSDEYKPDSVGWRVERCEIQGPRKSLFPLLAPGGACWGGDSGGAGNSGEMPSPQNFPRADFEAASP